MLYPELQGETAIITGAHKGIGRGIAEILAAQGMNLVLTSRSTEAGEQFVQSLREKGYEATWVSADLQKMKDAEKVLSVAVERYSVPYLLVNNAVLPYRPQGKALQFNEDVFNQDLIGNIRIYHHISYLTYSRMAEEHKGVIVNISSVGGLRSHRSLMSYDMSKGTMDAFTRGLSLELAPYGIRVNSLAPGAISKDSTTDKRSKNKEGIPLGRLGTPDEIGKCVAFLASEGAAYITGQTIYVDGGLTTQLTPTGIFI